ncbi:MAG: PqqD family peptide modification chaperone [candidate division NC10 bacterium]|nr:PqqD family peptide modification chaperone [candidate division NC10 bacterium]
MVQELPDEILVYDLTRHRAHCLNQTAALVWRHCDGQTTVAEMATLLQNELNIPADEAVVWLALDRLGKAHLLKERMTPPTTARYSRREFVRRLALVGGFSVLVPAVSSVIAPTAAQAATCVVNCTGQPNCTPCGPPSCVKRCRNGNCVSRSASGCP